MVQLDFLTALVKLSNSFSWKALVFLGNLVCYAYFITSDHVSKCRTVLQLGTLTLFEVLVFYLGTIRKLMV